MTTLTVSGGFGIYKKGQVIAILNERQRLFRVTEVVGDTATLRPLRFYERLVEWLKYNWRKLR